MLEAEVQACQYLVLLIDRDFMERLFQYPSWPNSEV